MAPKPVTPDDELYTPAEVANLFRVDTKTVGVWDRAGRFPASSVIRTLGGHRRYRATVIRAMLNGPRS